MKLLLEIDTSKYNLEETLEFIRIIYQNKKTPDQTTIPSDNNSSDMVSIVVRDGAENKTVDVKETLKELGFNYYAKTKSGKQDPRWTQTCSVEKWNDIQNDNVFDGLNIWTSNDDGGN